MRRLLFHLITALACLLLMGVGLEVWVRVVVDRGMQFDLEMWKYARAVKRVSADPLVGHEHRPDAAARLMGVDVKTNSEGLRDREFSDAKTPGVERIVMLGDSFTFGWGVRSEETVSKRLEGLFAHDGRRVEVINTGVGNYNTVQEVQYFLTRGYRLQPDLVVLNYVINDAEPVPRYPDFFLWRHSEALVYLAGRFNAFAPELDGRSGWADYYLHLYETPGWDAAKTAITRLRRSSCQHGFRLVVASWPELHDVKHYRLQRITGLVQQVASDDGVPFVDLLPAVGDQDSPRLWVSPEDPHPNGYANELVARHLQPILGKLLDGAPDAGCRADGRESRAEGVARGARE